MQAVSGAVTAKRMKRHHLPCTELFSNIRVYKVQFRRRNGDVRNFFSVHNER